MALEDNTGRLIDIEHKTTLPGGWTMRLLPCSQFLAHKIEKRCSCVTSQHMNKHSNNETKMQKIKTSYICKFNRKKDLAFHQGVVRPGVDQLS